MIPKEAIELAIQGGWKPRGEKIRKRFEVETDYAIFYDKVNVWRVPFEEIALDPSFWQALGKTKGWGKPVGEWSFQNRQDDMPMRPTAHWRNEAHFFYDLILTGGNTDEFWQSILSPKAEEKD